MATLMMFARYEIGFLLAALLAVVAFQLLTGRIKTRGLLSEKTRNGLGGVSPARVQLLMLTVAFAFYLLSEIVNSRQFPTIDTKWLLILGGSHSIYLGGKSLSLFRSQLK
jgi:membrane-bound acyltransferase YfiQ involved in biofilm formation